MHRVNRVGSAHARSVCSRWFGSDRHSCPVYFVSREAYLVWVPQQVRNDPAPNYGRAYLARGKQAIQGSIALAGADALREIIAILNKKLNIRIRDKNYIRRCKNGFILLWGCVSYDWQGGGRERKRQISGVGFLILEVCLKGQRWEASLTHLRF